MEKTSLENIEEKKQKSKIILVSIIYIISASLFLFIRIGNKFEIFSFLGKSKTLVLNSVNQLLFIAGLPILIYTIFSSKNIKTTFSDFKFKKVPKKIVGWSFLTGITLYGIIVILSTVWASVINLTGYTTPLFKLNIISTNSVWLNFAINIVLTCLLPALCEETLLRGCVLCGFERMGRKKAIIFVGLLFGLLHINIYQSVYAAIMGMILCIFTMMTGSIWPAIIMHFTSNFCSIFIEFVEKLNLFNGAFNNFFNSFFFGNPILSVVNYVAFGFLAVILFFSLAIKILKYSKSKSVYDKLQVIMQQNNLALGEKIEINDETSQTLIDMKNLIQSEILAQVRTSRKPFDFILPPNENDNYKMTKLEWFFVLSATFLTLAATLASFIGGLL